MAGLRTLLFLFGLSIVSASVLRNAKPCKHGHLHEGTVVVDPSLSPMAITAPAMTPFMPPFMSPFAQQGTNLFYKPQFMLPGMAIPSPITNVIENKKDCKHPGHIIAPIPLEELADIKPAFIVPEPPKLNEEIVVETVKPIVIPPPPALPAMPELPTPVIVEVPEYKPIEIPEPPVLPPFVMPELPTVVPSVPQVPVVIEVVEPEAKPVVIPEAPTLPPFVQPELPPVVIPIVPEFPHVVEPMKLPEPPVLPPFTMPEMPSIVVPVAPPCEELTEHKLVAIPEAPVLPPFTLPELPPVVLPVAPEYKPMVQEWIAPGPVVVAPKFPTFIEPVPEYKPIVIPEAPKLPPFVMPELPTPAVPNTHIVEEWIAPGPVVVAPEMSNFAEPIPEYKPVVIPEPPMLPPFVMPELPTPAVPNTHIVEEWIAPGPVVVAPEMSNFAEPIPEYKPVVIPEPPMLPPFVMPELPTPVVPKAPVVEEWIAPGPVVAVPELPDVILPEYKPVEIPSPPQLPPFEMPTIPEVVVPQVIPTVAIPEIEENKLVIPEAPQLPPFVMPELPTLPLNTVEILPSQEIVPTPVFPMIDVRIPNLKAMEIPQAPIPPMTIIPQPIVVEDGEEPCLENEISAVQTLPTLRIPEVSSIIAPGVQQQMPTFMAQNIIIERILPNMILDCDKNLGLDVKYPVFAKGYFVKQ